MDSGIRKSEHPHALLPRDVYLSVVDALYADTRSLIAGIVCSSLAAFLTFWKTGNWSLLFCALAMLAVGALRIVSMRLYARSATVTVEAARRWEIRYIFSSAVHVSVLGIWCLLTFTQTSDPVVRLISFAVTLGYLIGITGRNFSNGQLVQIQTVCAAPLMIGGLLLQKNLYYDFLAAVLVPFFLSIQVIAARLRHTLFEAVVATHDVKRLADQFDTALNNMPHGLGMFDSERRLVVANGRFNELLGLSGTANDADDTVREVLQKSHRLAFLNNLSQSRFISRFVSNLSASRRRTLPAEIQGGQHLDLTFQPMAQGGCVVVVEDVTERRRAQAKIQHLARYDGLTGLPNRGSFVERFERSLAEPAQGTNCAVLFIDLDQFKQVNDTLGHPCGDALLCQAADRLRYTIRETDMVARFGGDEFVVLQTNLSEKADAAALASRIVETLSGIYEVEGHQIMIGASIGIALYPEGGTTADQLIKSADIALYKAKADGRGIWRFFEADMDARAQARRQLELDIREALAREEFDLFYQPILDLDNGKVTSCEALLRWRHPARGMVPPAEFIPVAEEMGLIVDIGNWVIRRASRDCSTWPQGISVAVNLSAVQFRRSHVEAVIREALAAHALPPERFEVEITETALLQDTIFVRNTLESLSNAGIKIALDDFGTGYSSLSYLHSFPFNKVKIDRSFLTGIETDPRVMTLVRGIARLSEALGLTVVVEGVETPPQLSLLRMEKSISNVQGYLFSTPLSADQIAEFLRVEAASPGRFPPRNTGGAGKVITLA